MVGLIKKNIIGSLGWILRCINVLYCTNLCKDVFSFRLSDHDFVYPTMMQNIFHRYCALYCAILLYCYIVLYCYMFIYCALENIQYLKRSIWHEECKRWTVWVQHYLQSTGWQKKRWNSFYQSCVKVSLTVVSGFVQEIKGNERLVVVYI